MKIDSFSQQISSEKLKICVISEIFRFLHFWRRHWWPTGEPKSCTTDASWRPYLDDLAVRTITLWLIPRLMVQSQKCHFWWIHRRKHARNYIVSIWRTRRKARSWFLEALSRNTFDVESLEFALNDWHWMRCDDWLYIQYTAKKELFEPRLFGGDSSILHSANTQLLHSWLPIRFQWLDWRYNVVPQKLFQDLRRIFMILLGFPEDFS